MSNNTLASMGAMATPFVAGGGNFDATTGAYEAATSSFGLDAQYLNTQHALNASLGLGGGVIKPEVARLAGILPAAIKIQEHKDMQKVADRYFEKYIKDFNRKYGFSDAQIKELIKEFTEVTDEIKKLIPDDEMRKIYSKYIESYPTMYLSMIPAEALQTKLAVKCVTDNKILRDKIEEMSGCVSSLVKNLTDLQISAGIPPIVNLMFESMPDPLTAMTDPMYHKYNDAIVTYHKLLKDEDDAPTGSVSLSGNNIDKRNDYLRLEPVVYLQKLVEDGNTRPIMKADGSAYQEGGKNVEVTLNEIKELKTIMENMQTQSGCQPFGQEWNHTGPTPPMNPAMCLDDNNKFQAGNPRHNVGRTNLYQAKRDPSGHAHWVQTGQVPALSNGGGPQMVQHQPQPLQQPDPWAGVNYAPGVDPRPSPQNVYQRPGQQVVHQMPPQRVQFNDQPFVGSGGTPGPRSSTRKSTGRKTKSAKAKGPRTSRNRAV